MEHLPDDRVTIVLHTLGGCVTACVLIANALQQFKDSTAIVPYMAISGGTLIALSATRLEMGGRASLSAVDPQIMGQRVKHLAESKDKPSIAALAREYDVSMRKYVRTRLGEHLPEDRLAPRWTCSWASTRRTSGRSSGPRSRPGDPRDTRREPVVDSGRRPPGSHMCRPLPVAARAVVMDTFERSTRSSSAGAPRWRRRSRPRYVDGFIRRHRAEIESARRADPGAAAGPRRRAPHTWSATSSGTMRLAASSGSWTRRRTSRS
jgi:hypothetical protein